MVNTPIKQKQSAVEQFTKASLLIKIGLSFLILIIVLALGYFFDTSAQIKRIKQLKAERVTLTTKLAAETAKLNQQKIVKHNIAVLEKYIQSEAAEISPQMDQSKILEDIHAIGAKQQIQFTYIKPQKREDKAFYSILPIEIAVTGDYHRIAQFISSLGNLKAPIVTQDFRIKHDKDSDNLMNITLVANLFTPNADSLKTKYYPDSIIIDNKISSPALPTSAKSITYTDSTLRNPFTHMKNDQKNKYPNVIFRSVPLSQIKVLGVIATHNKKWAIIMPIGKNNDKMTYNIAVGDRISQSQALVTAIHHRFGAALCQMRGK